MQNYLEIIKYWNKWQYMQKSIIVLTQWFTKYLPNGSVTLSRAIDLRAKMLKYWNNTCIYEKNYIKVSERFTRVHYTNQNLILIANTNVEFGN